MNKYLENKDKIIQKYFYVLSNEFPDFITPYIRTYELGKQESISVTCGMFYTDLFDIDLWYSSLSHSIATSLIAWHFTHDKKQTLAALFHDIATPAFKHTIDYMNNDHLKQESTEELTRDIILNSREIMSFLKEDGIDIDEVCDYHIYPILDNDTPKLSSDRLEYTLSNGMGAVEKIWGINEIRKIYDNIIIVKNEENEEEMCFKSLDIAERFTEVMSKLSILYMNDERRYSMQLLSDIMKKMKELGYLKISDLYELRERDIIFNIRHLSDPDIRDTFNKWMYATKVDTSNELIDGKYMVKVNTKKRYIDPLVKVKKEVKRISEVSEKGNEYINNVLSYDFDRYLYIDEIDNKILKKEFKN